MPATYKLKTIKPWVDTEANVTRKPGEEVELSEDRTRVVLDYKVCEPKLVGNLGKKKTILAMRGFLDVGGIETAVENLVENYPHKLCIVTESITADWYLRLGKNAEIIIDPKHEKKLKCDTLVLVQYDSGRFLENIEAKHVYQQVHADFRKENLPDAKKYFTDKRIEKFLTVSEVVSEGLKDKFKLDSTVVPNCVAPKRQDPMLFGYFGRATREKGIPELTEFIRKCDEFGYDAEFIVATQNLRMFQPSAYAYMKDRKNVMLLEASKSALAWRKTCDYIIQLSTTEGTCESVKEALDAHIPVIVSRIPAFDYVIEGKTGYHIGEHVREEDLQKIFEKKPKITAREWHRETDTQLWNKVLGGKL